MSAPTLCCDLFCRVIDHLGDAGVCWRLARQLATEHGWRVRLFIDDPAPLERMAPGQHPVEICPWTDDFPVSEPADVVIEAFACALPPAYVTAMKTRARPPVWLNLEYLSAETWVRGCHALPSPQSGLSKHFFFPGFVPGTGGLLRERDIAVSRAAANPADPVLPPPTFSGALDVSLFCYDNPHLSALLSAWQSGGQAITVHVCDGLPQKQVAAWLGTPFPAMTRVSRGALHLVALPFLSQTDYDALLGRCHLNFVRGEDSFVRAQWAERPFVWQAYPQAANAHLDKLDAFLALYGNDAGTRAFFRAWNGAGVPDWPAFAARLPALAAHAPGWARRIAAPGDLTGNLVTFCTTRL